MYIVVRVHLYSWAIYRDDGDDVLRLHSVHDSGTNAESICRLLNRRAALLAAGRGD